MVDDSNGDVSLRQKKNEGVDGWMDGWMHGSIDRLMIEN